MKHLRSDYDDLTALDARIPDDEPVFLLRGQDPAAAPTVVAYARHARLAGADKEMTDRILDWAEGMAAYAHQAKHGAPDVPDGMLR